MMNRSVIDPNGRPGPGGRDGLDIRPSSPGQLALIGAGLWLVGFLLPVLSILSLVGILLLAVAGLSLLIRPRTRQTYWRGRPIELGEPGWGERLYRLIYRR